MAITGIESDPFSELPLFNYSYHLIVLSEMPYLIRKKIVSLQNIFFSGLFSGT